MKRKNNNDCGTPKSESLPMPPAGEGIWGSDGRVYYRDAASSPHPPPPPQLIPLEVNSDRCSPKIGQFLNPCQNRPQPKVTILRDKSDSSPTKTSSTGTLPNMASPTSFSPTDSSSTCESFTDGLPINTSRTNVSHTSASHTNVSPAVASSKFNKSTVNNETTNKEIRKEGLSARLMKTFNFEKKITNNNFKSNDAKVPISPKFKAGDRSWCHNPPPSVNYKPKCVNPPLFERMTRGSTSTSEKPKSRSLHTFSTNFTRPSETSKPPSKINCSKDEYINMEKSFNNNKNLKTKHSFLGHVQIQITPLGENRSEMRLYMSLDNGLLQTNPISGTTDPFCINKNSPLSPNSSKHSTKLQKHEKCRKNSKQSIHPKVLTKQKDFRSTNFECSKSKSDSEFISKPKFKDVVQPIQKPSRTYGNISVPYKCADSKNKSFPKPVYPNKINEKNISVNSADCNHSLPNTPKKPCTMAQTFYKKMDTEEIPMKTSPSKVQNKIPPQCSQTLRINKDVDGKNKQTKNICSSRKMETNTLRDNKSTSLDKSCKNIIDKIFENKKSDSTKKFSSLNERFDFNDNISILRNTYDNILLNNFLSLFQSKMNIYERIKVSNNFEETDKLYTNSKINRIMEDFMLIRL